MSADAPIVCPIVAIGTSVVGFDALEQLFDTLSADTGLAFAIVIHQAHTHERYLHELLARHSTMPVTEVSLDAVTPIRANHVYLITPDKFLTITKAGLRAVDPGPDDRLRMPIDRFLSALAESHQNASIAVIMSGSGSDGALGLEAIKAHGGVVVVQDPRSASHDSMPRSAIDTGLVDCIAKPTDIPAFIASFAQQTNRYNKTVGLASRYASGMTHSYRDVDACMELDELLIRPLPESRSPDADLQSRNVELAHANAQLEARVAELQLRHDFAGTIIDTVREPLLVLDKNLVVQSANRSFHKKFAVTLGEIQNCLIYEIGRHQWNFPALRTLLEEILPRDHEIENFPVEHIFPTIGARSFLLNARYLEMPSDEPARILLAFEDTTEHEVTRQLKRNAETFSRLVDESPFGIYVVDSDFRIARFSKGGRSAFRKVIPLIGRDFSEAIHILWSEKLADDIVRQFRRTLETGEPYISTGLTAKRLDIGEVESYEWQVHRVTLPDGSYGVVCYFFDSSDIRAAEQAAHESEQSALHANRTKSEFLAHVSHEIRTPMSAILGYAELLLNQLKNNEYLHEVKIIKSSGESLLRLVDDLLDLSSIEAGKLQIEPDRCELDVLLADVMSQVQMRASEKDLNLTLDYVGSIPQSIETDAGRVQQILLNLLINAIKFTDNGDVSVRVTYLAGPTPSVQFNVTDTGKGMSKSRLKKLFQPFERASRRDYGGTGLGLYISHSLAERLHGTLAVKSTLNQGSSFTLTIPTGTPEKVELVTPRTASAAPKSIAELSAKLSDKHILIADDQPAVRGLLKQFVESAGGTVTTATNGQMALDSIAAVHDKSVDAVILDLQMPVLDGLATAQTLRQGGYTAPIMAITANALHSSRRECLAAGFDAYMNKPIIGNALISKLHQLIEGKPQRRVLVVDDAPESADPLSRLLRIKGFDVQTIYTGASVMAAIDAFLPHVVMLDISLPDMDGYQVADLIQQRLDTRGIELIALTGHDTEADRQAIRTAGFRHHLVKPVNMDQLLIILQHNV